MLSCLHLQLFLCCLNTLAGTPEIDEGIAIHEQPYLVVAADIEDQRLVTGRDEGAVETGRAVLQVDAGGKDGIAAITQFDGFGRRDSGHGCTLHLGVIIVDDLHAQTAQGSLQLAETALNALVARQSATL